jgi:protein SCO1/2
VTRFGATGDATPGRIARRGRRWLPLAAMLALASGGVVAGEAYTFRGIVSDERPRAADFTLTAHTGKRVGLHRFDGKVRLLYFGYTHCPGICPTTLAELGAALRGLTPRQSARTQVLFVSVDPKRDTPERLAAYLAHFSRSFVGLTGSVDEIARVAAAYGIYYRVTEGPTPAEYLVDHTSMVIVIDEAGFVRLLFPFGTAAPDMAEDLRHLLR